MTTTARTAKALRLYDIEQVQLDEVPVSAPGSGEVLVRNVMTGICATDRHAIHDGTFVDRNSPTNYPAILGHEGCSEILELGEGVEIDGAGNEIKPGDMVVYQDILGCGRCRFCRQGASNVCPSMKVAAQKPGHFVQYYCYPSQLLIRVDGITFEQGALVEPAAVALHGARRGGIQAGDVALVLGGGPIALLRLQHLRTLGAGTIVVAEKAAGRRRIASELGSDVVLDPTSEPVKDAIMDLTKGMGADIVFEDVGLPDLQLLALECVRPHGTCVITGIATTPVTLNFTDRVMLRELTIKGSNGYSMWWDRPHDYSVIARLMSAGRLQTKPLISHVYPLDEFAEAFRMAGDSEQAIKVVFDLHA